MSINVTPSAGADLLDVRFAWDGMVMTPEGEYIEIPSSTAAGYYSAKGIDISDYSYFEDYDYVKGVTP